MEIKESSILLTTGVYDEAIFKWKLVIEEDFQNEYEEAKAVDAISKEEFRYIT